MAEVSLIRVDMRMVHGQVAIKWSAASHATKIICVDDVVAANETLKTIYKLAAPSGTKVLCYSIEKTVAKWNEHQFKDGVVMILFKDVKTCYATYKAGLPIPKLQLGNSPRSATNTFELGNEFFVDEQGLKLLKEMAADGVKIEVQTIPEQSAVSFDRAISKFQ